MEYVSNERIFQLAIIQDDVEFLLPKLLEKVNPKCSDVFFCQFIRDNKQINIPTFLRIVNPAAKKVEFRIRSKPAKRVFQTPDLIFLESHFSLHFPICYLLIDPNYSDIFAKRYLKWDSAVRVYERRGVSESVFLFTA